jgi:hypothetical protein
MINENLQDPSRTMSGGEVIFQGWLRKSPPEKKLRRYVRKIHFYSLFLYFICIFIADVSLFSTQMAVVMMCIMNSAQR